MVTTLENMIEFARLIGKGPKDCETTNKYKVRHLHKEYCALEPGRYCKYQYRNNSNPTECKKNIWEETK